MSLSPIRDPSSSSSSTFPSLSPPASPQTNLINTVSLRSISPPLPMIGSYSAISEKEKMDKIKNDSIPELNLALRSSITEAHRSLIETIKSYCETVPYNFGGPDYASKIHEAVFAAIHNLKGLQEALNTSDPANAIKELVVEHMQAIRSQLNSRTQQEERYHFQNPGAFYTLQTTIEMLKLLIGENTVFFGLEDALTKTFSCDHPSKFSQLSDIDDYKKAFLNMTAPNNADYDLAIRATLGLSPNQPVTSRDARIFALTNWMGSYASTPESELSFISNLFFIGGSGIRVPFPEVEHYGHAISKGSCNLAVYPQEAYSIWDAPSIQQACHVVGIELTPELRDEAAKLWFEHSPYEIAKVSVKDICYAIAWASQKIQGGDQEITNRLTEDLYFAFSTTSQFPMEAQNYPTPLGNFERNLRQRLNQNVYACFAAVFHRFCAAVDGVSAENRLTIEERLTQLFFERFMFTAYYEHDSTQGKWNLMRGDVIIQNPDEFQSSVSAIAKDAWEWHRYDGILSKQESQTVQKVIYQMQCLVDSPEFTKNCFKFFMPGSGNDSREDIVTNWEQYNTPLQIHDCPSDHAFINAKRFPIFEPNDAADALQKIADFCQENSSLMQKKRMIITNQPVLFDPDPRIVDPNAISNLEETGRSLMEKGVSIETAARCREECFKLLSKDLAKKAQTKFNRILSEDETIGSYFNKLMETVLTYADFDPISEIQSKICNINLKYLGEEEFKSIMNNGVSIFDTLQNERVMFYFDPTVGKIQLGLANASMTTITNCEEEFLCQKKINVWGICSDQEIQETANFPVSSSST